MTDATRLHSVSLTCLHLDDASLPVGSRTMQGNMSYNERAHVLQRSIPVEAQASALGAPRGAGKIGASCAAGSSSQPGGITKPTYVIVYHFKQYVVFGILPKCVACSC